MWNLLFYVIDDDRDRSSAFLRDFPHLAELRQYYPAIKAHIRFTSKFHHGSFNYSVAENRIRLSPIEDPVKSTSRVMSDLTQFTHQHYDPSRKNAIFFSIPHCYKEAIRPFSRDIPLLEWSEYCRENQFHFELACMDCCYLATMRILTQFRPVVSYVVGCQTSSSYLGFNSPQLAHIFATTHRTFDVARKLVDSMVERNDRSKVAALRFWVDGVVLRTKGVDALASLVNQVTWTRKTRYRVEPTYSDLYDLTSLILHHPTLEKESQRELFRALHVGPEAVVAYFRKSDALEKKPLGKRLFGLSIVLRRTTQRGL